MQHDFGAEPSFLQAGQMVVALPDCFAQARVVSVTPVVETRIASARKNRIILLILFY